ncbi:synaptotagmin-5-like [Lotus japonicus]|uniref:synaptotagmin-5-like n=1 Tax=Lotus japonicus TaxID=34305 RepID=UPI00258DEBB5|nr:synaptotagmin-5-like [Lotus japonicus]
MHLRSPKLIGYAQIRLSELQPGRVKYVWPKLFKPSLTQRDNKNRGQVHMELLYCPFGMENSFTNLFAPNYSMEEVLESSANEIEANGNENAVTQREKEVIISGFLSVTVISAEDLPALDFMGKSDPFVVLTLRKAKLKEEIRHKTKVVNQSLNPVWIETFPVEDGLHDMVIVEVWDKDTFGKDYIGRCILSLTKVILEGEYTDSFDLVGAKSGSLELHLKWRF